MNARKVKDSIVQWIRDYFAVNGPECSAVVGISGGKDSTIVAALCVEALGADRVVGVLLPQGMQQDIDDSYSVIKHLGITHHTFNIAAIADGVAMVMALQEFALSEQAKINLPPRIRMAMLYAVAQSLPSGGRVANTCNYSEDYVGYSTKFGDSAGDFSPLAQLTVSQVKKVGYELGLPSELIDKTPADGLCGKTDEDNLGFTYDQLEQYINTGSSGDPGVDDRIETLHDRNLHKLEPMPVFLPRYGDLD